jgi:hypothetical protein
VIFLLILLLFVSFLAVVLVVVLGGIVWIVTSVSPDAGLAGSAVLIVVGIVLIAWGRSPDRVD